MSRTVSLVTCAMRVMSVSARSIDRGMLLPELLQLLGHRPGEYPADPAREARVEPLVVEEQSVVGQVDNATLVLQGTTRHEDGGFVVQLDLGGPS